MSKETLEALDKAVREHYADVLSTIPETHPVVGAWVLAVEVQTLEDGELRWDNDYTTGEATSPNAAVGLAMYLGDELRTGALGMNYDDEEESDGES